MTMQSLAEVTICRAAEAGMAWLEGPSGGRASAAFGVSVRRMYVSPRACARARARAVRVHPLMSGTRLPGGRVQSALPEAPEPRSRWYQGCGDKEARMGRVRRFSVACAMG